jgi:hypothetical protein
LDLVAEARDVKTVAHWVTSAVQDRRTTPEQLRRAAGRRRALANRRELSVLIDDRSRGSQRVEVDYLRNVERRHALPVGRRQIASGAPRSTSTTTTMRRWSSSTAGAGTPVRAASATCSATTPPLVRGLLTLRYGYADVHDRACEVALEVGTILGSRGWPGTVGRCDLVSESRLRPCSSRGGYVRDYAAEFITAT